MIVFLNGRFVPEKAALVSVFDRSFLYGDGLFETIRCYNGKPFRWFEHIVRLCCGADFLKIEIPCSAEELRRAVDELVSRNRMPDSTLRITLSRGVGVRGYSPKGADHPTVVMSLHPAPVIDPANPPRWKLITSSLRVPANDRVAHYKTCNKLHQILARVEAESRGADEALVLNTNGEIAEGASSNVFWIDDGTVCTTPLASGILAGVTRALVIELCRALSLSVLEKAISPGALKRTGGVFLSLSTFEIVEAVEIDGSALARAPLINRLREAYHEAVVRETVGSAAS